MPLSQTTRQTGQVPAQEAKPKTRYSDSELQTFKRVILDKLVEAKADLKAAEASMKGTSDSGDTIGDGAITLEKERYGNDAVRAQNFIDKLEKALVRIENKTYGICTETQKLIPEQRLFAVPHTTLSMEAKMKN